MLFGKKAEPEVVITEEVKPVEFAPEHKTIIGSGMTFEGEFTSTEAFEVKGTIKGNVNTTNDMHIAKGGFYDGDAKVANIVVDGCVEGNIDCDDLAVFTDTGAMTGTLAAKRLQTDPGSGFEGTLTLKKSAAQAQPAAPVVPLEEGDVAVTAEDLLNE